MRCDTAGGRPTSPTSLVPPRGKGAIQEGSPQAAGFLSDTISGLLGRHASRGEVPGEAHAGIFQSYALIILMRKQSQNIGTLHAADIWSHCAGA